MPTPEKHIFQKINTDLEPRFMQPGMYRYLLNGIVAASDSDNLGSVENAVGTTLRGKVGESDNNDTTALKIYTDKETNTLIIFLVEKDTSDKFDTIWRYDPSGDVFDKIIEWDGLLFDKDLKITGVDVVNGNIIFTDNLNEIRKINIATFIEISKGITEEDFTFDFYVIGAITNGNAVFGIASDITNRITVGQTLEITVDTGLQPSGTYEVTSFFTFGGNTFINTNTVYVDNGTGSLTVVSLPVGSGFKEEDITLLRRGPRFPLATVTSEDENVQQNSLERNSFQFTYRYVYLDNEKSVFAPLSKTSLIASRDDLSESNNNVIECRMPNSEEVRFTVKAIEWLFRIDNTNEFALFKVTPTTERVVFFRNDVAGATLSAAEVLLSFHDVPLMAKGLRVAENRVFLNNYTTGFDKTNVSISVEVDPALVVLFTGQKVFARKVSSQNIIIPGFPADPPVVTFENYWWQHPSGNWFRVTNRGVNEDIIFIINIDPGQGDGTPHGDIAFTEQVGFYTITYFVPAGVASFGDNVSVLSSPRTDTPMFKAGDTYQLGIRFSDHLGRNNGIYTNDSARVVIPEHVDPKKMDDSPGNISWTLNKESTIIPDWATHYEIMRTRNLSRTFFLQGDAVMMVFGRRNDTSDGSSELLLIEGSAPPDHKIYLYIQNSIKYKIGYVFSEGDRVKFYYFTGFRDAKIVGQDGPWLILDNIFKAGEVLVFLRNIFYEIYTPYLGSLDESFYEIGIKHSIDNPGEDDRDFSVKTGSLTGDIHRKKREIYPLDNNTFVLSPEESRVIELLDTPNLEDFEAMNPNDDYYERWVSDIGRSSIVLMDVRRQTKKFTLKFGGNYSVDSLVNNISAFNPGDEHPMPIENGPSTSLAVTNNNLIYFHEQNASAIYINEGFTSTADGGDSLIRLVNTVGDDRKLALGHGCIHPESVAEYADKVWFWDMHKGAVVRYAQNGLVPISDDGMKNYFYELSRRLLPFKNELKVYGEYDPYLDYYILTFAPVASANYLGETFAFSERSGGGVGWFSFEPSMYGSINKTLFSFKDGQLWSHDNSDNCNVFYGVDYNRTLRLIGNQEGSLVKIWANFRVDAESITQDLDSNAVIIKITNDQGQEGRVIAHQVEKREGVFIGAFRQDVNTPNSTNIAFSGGDDERHLYFMYNGDVLRSQICEVELVNDRRDLSPLYAITILYRVSEVSFS